MPSSIETIGKAAGLLVPVVGHLLGRERAALVLEHVAAVLEDLAGRRIERDVDVAARLVAGGLDPGDEHLERLRVRLEIGSEAALVAARGAEAAVLQGRLQRVEDLGPDPQALRKGRRRRRGRP